MKLKELKGIFVEDRIFIWTTEKMLGEGIGLSNELIEKFGEFQVLHITVNPYEDSSIDVTISLKS